MSNNIDNGRPLPAPKKSTEDTLAGRRDAERRANVVPTREDILQPTLDLHRRSIAERDARFRAVEIAKFQSWHTRAKGRPATDAAVAEYLGDTK